MDESYLLQNFLFILLQSETGFTTYASEALVLILLLVCSAFISASEVAFFALSKQQIDACKRENTISAKNLVSLLANHKVLLATILIVNNLVNISFVTLSTFIMLDLIGNDADQTFAISVLTFLTTFAIVFFGEVLPKVFSNQSPLRVALFSSNAFVILCSLAKPLAWVLIIISSLVERKIKKKGYKVSVDELNAAVEMTTESETSEDQKELLKGIVNFGTITVKQIMRSRMDISALDVHLNFHELIENINDFRYSRTPVYHETLDHIEGILYIKDLIPYIDREKEFKWQDLIRKETFFIPENKKIDLLLKDFQEKRVHMAVVVDEYGGTSGLITLEDIIEEIVGEINDEYDSSDVIYKKIDTQTYTFEGKTSLNDFCKLVEVDASVFHEVKGDSESLAGVLLEMLSRMPRIGEKIKFKQFTFIVVSLDKTRIKTVRVLIKN